MIKKVTLYNFQSHENTTINFESNFNLIVGQSNSGKSAIIRAIGVVVNNDWNKDMVRTGNDFCRVTVYTDKGWVEAERGQKINKWRCQENGKEIQDFKNVGVKVPDLATKILGMGQRDRGNDIKELPNFQFQLQKHYMLSQIGEKKATSNMIARMMDNAIGLGGMQDLIKDISTDLLKDKKWLTEKTSEMTELKASILDEKIFNSYEKMINDIDNKNKVIEEFEEDIEAAEKYKNKYDEILNHFNKCNDFISCFNKFDKIILIKGQIEHLLKKINIYEKAYDLFKKMNELKASADVNVNELNELIDECIKKKKLIDLCERAYLNDKKLNEIKEISMIDINILKQKQDEIVNKFNEISKAENKLQSARELWKKKYDADKEYKKLEKDIKSYEDEYEKLKDELGVCPLCGEKFK